MGEPSQGGVVTCLLNIAEEPSELNQGSAVIMFLKDS